MNGLARMSVLGVLVVVACGGDSTNPTAPIGPTDQAALQSLTMGMAAVTASAASSDAGFALGMLPPVSAFTDQRLSQTSITVDGTPVQVFALARRVTYPSGTCLEQLLGISNFANPGSCTSFPGVLSLILWQTSSASQAPDRVVVILADAGNASFAGLSSSGDPFLTGTVFPPIGIYLERSGAVWLASGGSLSSTVTATGQTCTMAPPIFAKSATCGMGSFLETGSIAFSPLELGGVTTTGTRSVAISAQTLSGMIQTVTATTPVSIPISG